MFCRQILKNFRKKMSCLSYFYGILARKDYSVFELKKKGKDKGFEMEEIEEVIASLQERGLQSDERLIENLIQSYQEKYGKSVIKRKCLQKGIDGDLFEEVWLRVRTENEGKIEQDLLLLKEKSMRKYKIEDWKKIDPKTKAKLIHYLQYRGFNPFDLLEQWQNQS